MKFTAIIVVLASLIALGATKSIENAELEECVKKVSPALLNITMTDDILRAKNTMLSTPKKCFKCSLGEITNLRQIVEAGLTEQDRDELETNCAGYLTSYKAVSSANKCMDLFDFHDSYLEKHYPSVKEAKDVARVCTYITRKCDGYGPC